MKTWHTGTLARPGRAPSGAVSGARPRHALICAYSAVRFATSASHLALRIRRARCSRLADVSAKQDVGANIINYIYIWHMHPPDAGHV